MTEFNAQTTNFCCQKCNNIVGGLPSRPDTGYRGREYVNTDRRKYRRKYRTQHSTFAFITQHPHSQPSITSLVSHLSQALIASTAHLCLRHLLASDLRLLVTQVANLDAVDSNNHV